MASDIWRPLEVGSGRPAAAAAAASAAAALAGESKQGVPNMRRVIELPNTLLASGDYGRLSELLGSLDLLEIMDQSVRPTRLEVSILATF